MHVTRLNILPPLLFMLIMLVPIALLRISANPRWLADSPWPMFMHDPQRTGRSKYLGAQTNSSKWRFRTGGWVYSSPAIGSDGTIYVVALMVVSTLLEIMSMKEESPSFNRCL